MKKEFNVIREIMDMLTDYKLQGTVCVVDKNDSVRIGTNMTKKDLHKLISDVDHSFKTGSEIELLDHDSNNLN